MVAKLDTLDHLRSGHKIDSLLIENLKAQVKTQEAGISERDILINKLRYSDDRKDREIVSLGRQRAFWRYLAVAFGAVAAVTTGISLVN